MNTKTKIIQRNLLRYVGDVMNFGEKVKCGIWQANELFSDQEMLVLRRHNLILDIGGLDLKDIGADVDWAEEHFQERISGNPTNPGESYKRWPYAQFKDDNDPYKDGKKFSHTYQERIWPKLANAEEKGYYIYEGIRYKVGDLQDVINQLRDNPLTRQAYLPIFFPEDTGAVHKQRVPCTIGYYFWISGGKLHCDYTIRSCDVLRHFRNDVYLTSRLLQYVADQLQLEYGTLAFNSFNSHVFVNDLYALRKRESGINYMIY